MPSTPRYQRQGQLVFVRGEPIGPTVHDFYPKIPTTVLGTIQIVCGVIQLGLIVPSVVYEIYGLAESMLDATIWAVLAGSFSIAAGRSKTSCKVTATLVLSILSAVAASVGSFMIVTLILDKSEMLDENYEKHNVLLVMMVIVSIVETVVAVTSSVISCHFSCICCKNCCCKYDTSTTQQMLLYDPTSDQCELRGVVTISAEENYAPQYMVDNGSATGESTQGLFPPDYKQ